MFHPHELADNDTIAAIATPMGCGGIGVIRISGSEAPAIAQKLFSQKQKGNRSAKTKKGQFCRSHFLNYGYIIEPDSGRTIDEVLLAVMAAPKTYTREDIVEIQCHSGPVVLAKILELVIQSGARLAWPGEFTRRAFINGRIDLNQAEAVADMINAKSEDALHLANKELNGSSSEIIYQWIDILREKISILQGIIEFPEEIEVEIDRNALAEEIKKMLCGPIQDSIKKFKAGQYLREGLRLSIIGRPNVGKSSLLNRLINKERAIVTDVPGTTRDLIEDFFSIRGIPIVVTDTAGLQKTQDPVERIGIQKTRENIDQSDLILLVVDGRKFFDQEDLAIFRSIKKEKIIWVVNKIDLVASLDDMRLPEEACDMTRIYTSALKGTGIEELKETIAERGKGGCINPGIGAIIPNMRQKQLLKSALIELNRSVEGLGNSLSEELIAEDLDRGLRAIESIVGKNVESDVLDDIFNRFCIGK